ncbi:unnamed protein product, partial [Leptidea sinapis]
MERQKCNSLQNFDEPKSEILKKRLLKASNTCTGVNISQNNAHNVLLNTLRAPSSNSMIVSSVQAPQSSMSITHNLVTHPIAPVKIHPNNSPYQHMQLSTVHVPVQIPGSTSNINVPVQLSSGTSSVPLQLAPCSLPLQVSGTTTVPVQLPAGETINVPLQIPGNQNIQLTGPSLPSMPILQNTAQSLHNSIIHLHMGSNTRQATIDGTQDISIGNQQLQLQDSGMQVKMNSTPVSQGQMASNSTIVQIPNSSNSSIQLLPTAVNTGAVQLRGTARTVPHVVYIQTPTGLKPVANTEVISQASTSGNPPQIIVRRPVVSTPNIHVISNVGNKPNIAPKLPGQKGNSILAPANSAQPIVIQKPKLNEKMMVPVSIAPNTAATKQAMTYIGSIQKPNIKNMPDKQSILISSNQATVNPNNQKLYITPVIRPPRMQSTKFILPVTLPATMATKGPVINLQIANGQIQNDPQGNITVMRDTPAESTDVTSLAKMVTVNGTECSVPESSKSDKQFTISISGSRAEPTGEQGEYSLSIPETNASMNDDIYTVSIANDEGSREKSFTLAIPEKGKSLLNKNCIDRNDVTLTVAAPAILRRSNSDNTERKTVNANIKRRISLCAENFNKNIKMSQPFVTTTIKTNEQTAKVVVNDDHRVPSLFCDEKLDKDRDSDNDDYKDKSDAKKTMDKNISKVEDKREDPLGLLWRNGVAELLGSGLKFKTNEFGLIDLINDTTPKALEKKDKSSPEDLYQCDGCGCHGMAAEFINQNFCSVTCQNDYQKAFTKKRERERAELTKKRNKMKKILMSKQNSDSLEDNKEDTTDLKHGAFPETQISEVLLMKMNDDLMENDKYPWMCGKNGFSWMRYLDVCKAKAAPVKLFKDPFPYNKNGFKVGMRLEAIDPQHPSMFCVVSVAEVQGYRMRLHFDEYPDVYDYWVNADSPDIFPAGWCEKNGRSLTPPAGHSAARFSWPMYLRQMRAIAAPRQLFPHLTSSTLEAEDRANEMVCVATVVDTLDSRLLINYDSWDDMYDCWLDPASPYIHPVGWARENGVPFLIRVATISAVKGHQVRVSFDGWPDELSYWLEDDSPDIHPVGWCLKTGHPLEPPLKYLIEFLMLLNLNVQNILLIYIFYFT